jgi:signal transduction histidine kinase
LILIVDDSLTFREELGEKLEADGFEVKLCATARDAFESLERIQPEVILLDLVMPEMSGDEVCQKIKADSAIKHLPIVMITAQEDHQTLLQCFAAGADDFITKSSDFEVIKARIKAQVRRKHLEDENRKITEELSRKSAVEEHASRMRELYEEAQAAVQTRDEFLSIASHELKTPLSSLKLHVQMLKRLAEKNPADIPTAVLLPKLGNAEKQIFRLTRLIEDLLDVSRIQNNKFDCHFEAMDLVELVKEVAGYFEPEATRLGCSLDLGAHQRIVGIWDRSRLEQVVSNLIANALKYGTDKPIEIRIESGKAGVSLSVRDFGLGISKKDQRRIFNRFERAVSAGHFGGLGLGLYISSEIVHGHGGEIDVQSAPGQGAIFRVTLPWDSRDQSALRPQDQKRIS